MRSVRTNSPSVASSTKPAAAVTRWTIGAVLEQQALHAVEDGLVQRHVDHLPAAFRRLRADAGMAVLQRQQDLGHHAETGAVFVRAGLAVAVDAQHDQARVDSAQCREAEAAGFHRAGLEVLNQHVGLGDECTHGVTRGRVFQVERTLCLLRDGTGHHTLVP